MKTRERENERRNSIIVIILILLLGLICIILASGWAIRFAPHWKLNSSMGSNLESKNRVRPAVAIEVLRQLGAISSKQEGALAGFGPQRPVTNLRGIVTGQSRPVFEL